MAIHQSLALEPTGGLMVFLEKSREHAITVMIAANGEDLVRAQGAVIVLDELIKKFQSARASAEKLEAAERGRR